MTTKIAASLRTNLASCPDDFLKVFSVRVSELFGAEAENITLELHTGLEMLRDGRKDPMINIDIHHNSTNINKSTKIEIAADIAELMCEHLDIERDRTLVLFFDTKKCT